MAFVAQDTELAQWIDKSLDYLMSNWEAVPEIAAEWDDWDELERLDFVVEWPLREMRLRELQRWRDAGLLSPSQLDRFEQVEALINRNSRTLERLLED
jgi:hypothetical protein